jgi:hypothetical protein
MAWVQEAHRALQSNLPATQDKAFAAHAAQSDEIVAGTQAAAING